MINFINIENLSLIINLSVSDRAFSENQINIQAMCISSYSTKEGFVDSRFVNLKYIDSNKWTFFQIIIQNLNNFCHIQFNFISLEYYRCSGENEGQYRKLAANNQMITF